MKNYIVLLAIFAFINKINAEKQRIDCTDSEKHTACPNDQVKVRKK